MILWGFSCMLFLFADVVMKIERKNVSTSPVRSKKSSLKMFFFGKLLMALRALLRFLVFDLVVLPCFLLLMCLC